MNKMPPYFIICKNTSLIKFYIYNTCTHLVSRAF